MIKRQQRFTFTLRSGMLLISVGSALALLSIFMMRVELDRLGDLLSKEKEIVKSSARSGAAPQKSIEYTAVTQSLRDTDPASAVRRFRLLESSIAATSVGFVLYAYGWRRRMMRDASVPA